MVNMFLVENFSRLIIFVVFLLFPLYTYATHLTDLNILLGPSSNTGDSEDNVTSNIEDISVIGVSSSSSILEIFIRSGSILTEPSSESFLAPFGNIEFINESLTEINLSFLDFPGGVINDGEYTIFVREKIDDVDSTHDDLDIGNVARYTFVIDTTAPLVEDADDKEQVIIDFQAILE